MVILTLLLSLAQDTETVGRLHRESYQAALFEYDRAIFLTESDPRQALQIMDKIFDNKRIDRKDRRLVIERPNGQAKTYDFFPNQARGRIRLVLAKSDPENAAALVAGAVADLKASVDAGVKSSEEPYKNAKISQERLKYVKPPEPAKEGSADKAIKDSWQKLVDDKKWKSAKDLVESKGAALSPDVKKTLLRDTEERCRKAVAAALDDYLKALEFNSRPPPLRQLKALEFNKLFALPAETELVVSVRELDWARKERLVLERVRQTELNPRAEIALPLLDDLIARTLETEPFDKGGEDWWFRSSGELTVRFLEETVHGLVLRSKDAAPAENRKLRETAEKACAKWSEALSKVPRDFLARNPIHDNPKRLAAFLDEFPVDSAEVDRIDLEACFLGASPDLALEHVISELSKVRDQQEARLSKESSRKLLTELVAATAAHELLAGKSADEVSKGLQEVGRSLSKAGGPIDPGLWGPKIERIFAALK
jgi:hypothetical protein